MFTTKRRSGSPRVTLVPRTLCVLALAVGVPATTAASAEAAKPIADQYIVTLADGHDPQRAANALGATPRHVYRSALNGFAAKLNARQVEALRRNPNVVRIEQDQIVSNAGTQVVPDGDPWGLDRIDQTSPMLSGSYTVTQTGANVRAYVLDSGIQISHPQFEGRAGYAYNAIDDLDSDCSGHGTHVAGTIGGRTYGVAKKVVLRSVKVLDCDGEGANSDVIEGVDWVTAHHAKPAVANMSLGGSTSASLDAAVESLVMAGVFVSVAAGNDAANACDYSPARSPLVYTVAGTQMGDWIYSKTNHGPCVDIFAPARDIKSTVPFNATDLKSGTSMAAPHVAGTAALLCSASPAQCNPLAIMNWLQSNSVKGAVKGLFYAGTANRLLFKAGL